MSKPGSLPFQTHLTLGRKGKKSDKPREKNRDEKERKEGKKGEKRKRKEGNKGEKRKRKKKKKEKKKKVKRKKIVKKGKKEKERRKSNGLTASHPSVKGQRPQERWIGAHWESQETPVAQLPSFGFGPHYRLPAFCL